MRSIWLLVAAAGVASTFLLLPGEVPILWIEGEAPASSTFEKHGWYDDVRRDVLSAGDWLSHYGPRPGEATWQVDVTRQGEYDVWVRCSDLLVTQDWRVDAGEWKACDLTSDPREQITVSPQPDHRRVGWHRLASALVFTEDRHEIAFRVRSEIQNHGGIDCFVLGPPGWVPSGSAPPDPNAPPGGPSTWFPFVPGEDPFSKASIIDLSDRIPRPAGGFGFITRRGKELFAGDRPIKLWGVGANIEQGKSREWHARWASYLVKHGINAVRQHPLESWLGPLRRDPATGAARFDAERLDAWDAWFATLTEHGIYMVWSVFYPQRIGPEAGYELWDDLPATRDGRRKTGGLVCIEPALEALEWEYVSTLLCHVNPYTGRRYVDDPALAVLEVRNEDSIFWHWPLNVLATGKEMPEHARRLRGRWARWVRDRYGSDEALARAWGDGRRASDSVASEELELHGAWEMGAEGPHRPDERARVGDFIRFLAEAQRSLYDRREKALRELGFRAITVTTAWRAGGAAADAANLWCDDAMDMIDRHNYFGGGEGGHNVKPGNVNAESHLGDPGGGLLSMGFYQMEDKPFGTSEWTMSPPNQWKAEAAPLITFYGMGLQGWDASFHFLSISNRLAGGWPSERSYATDTPHYMGLFPALAIAVHDSHLREADIVAARRLRPADLFGGVDPLGQDFTGGGHDAKSLRGHLATPKWALAVGRVTVDIADDVPDPLLSDLTAWRDETAGVIRSATGELEWHYRDRFVRVLAPKTHAVLGFAAGRHELPAADIDLTTPFATLILTALDDRPLTESGHVLITALARDRQKGAEYSEDGATLLSLGTPPLLLEPVQATIRLRGPPVRSVRPVDIYGVPRDEEIPVTESGFAIDGRFASYSYEVRR